MENNGKNSVTHMKRNSPHILVVDDEEQVRKILFLNLSQTYPKITVSSSAEDAMNKLKTLDYDIVVTDINMPGLSGTQFFELCKNLYPELKFIMITGIPKYNDAINLVKEGAFYYIAKPIENEMLCSVIDKAFAEICSNRRSSARINVEIKGYKVISTIGHGNTGTVVLAEKDNVKYAIKILRRELNTEKHDIILKRFIREAEILKSVQHPNIVRIYDFDFDETGDPYFVMEFIQGRQLSQIIKENKLNLEQRFWIISQIAAGLEHIHEMGILHRDIKPENIIARDDNSVTITDFGICRTLNSDLTITREIMGSPAYMSPESFDSAKNLDRRSDIFSLGVVSYELLTGAKPFHGQTVFQILDAIREKKPLSPLKVNPALPSWVQDFLAKMINKNPDSRFSSASQVMKAIEYFTSERQPVSTGITTKILRGLLSFESVWS